MGRGEGQRREASSHQVGKCKSALTSGEDDYCGDSKAPQERRRGTHVHMHTLTRAHTRAWSPKTTLSALNAPEERK